MSSQNIIVVISPGYQLLADTVLELGFSQCTFRVRQASCSTKQIKHSNQEAPVFMRSCAHGSML